MSYATPVKFVSSGVFDPAAEQTSVQPALNQQHPRPSIQPAQVHQSSAAVLQPSARTAGYPPLNACAEASAASKPSDGALGAQTVDDAALDSSLVTHHQPEVVRIADRHPPIRPDVSASNSGAFLLGPTPPAASEEFDQQVTDSSAASGRRPAEQVPPTAVDFHSGICLSDPAAPAAEAADVQLQEQQQAAVHVAQPQLATPAVTAQASAQSQQQQQSAMHSERPQQHLFTQMAPPSPGLSNLDKLAALLQRQGGHFISLQNSAGQRFASAADASQPGNTAEASMQISQQQQRPSSLGSHANAPLVTSPEARSVTPSGLDPAIMDDGGAIPRTSSTRNHHASFDQGHAGLGLNPTTSDPHSNTDDQLETISHVGLGFAADQSAWQDTSMPSAERAARADLPMQMDCDALAVYEQLPGGKSALAGLGMHASGPSLPPANSMSMPNRIHQANAASESRLGKDNGSSSATATTLPFSGGKLQHAAEQGSKFATAPRSQNAAENWSGSAAVLETQNATGQADCHMQHSAGLGSHPALLDSLDEAPGLGSSQLLPVFEDTGIDREESGTLVTLLSFCSMYH